ncbi:hypothetical protein CLOM621_06736 [Clostridium sp. M62/1]|nr:hypothetical protein CLOM621_06736 [Clostridium sp. M62/1]
MVPCKASPLFFTSVIVYAFSCFLSALPFRISALPPVFLNGTFIQRSSLRSFYI